MALCNVFKGKVRFTARCCWVWWWKPSCCINIMLFCFSYAVIYAVISVLPYLWPREMFWKVKWWPEWDPVSLGGEECFEVLISCYPVATVWSNFEVTLSFILTLLPYPYSSVFYCAVVFIALFDVVKDEEVAKRCLVIINTQIARKWVKIYVWKFLIDRLIYMLIIYVKKKREMKH